jgi:hypothetical protein
VIFYSGASYSANRMGRSWYKKWRESRSRFRQMALCFTVEKVNPLEPKREATRRC